MENNDPQLTLARAVGKLEGVIGELSSEIKGLRTDMKNKIDEKQSKSIAKAQVTEHEDRLHRKDIGTSGVLIRADGAVVKRLIPWVAGAGGGTLGIWALLEKFLGQ